MALSFGRGANHVLVIGGIHGDEFGIDVANALAAYLQIHPTAVPAGSEIDIVPCANPDGCAERLRVNARGVDINRNFPTGWSTDGARVGESAGSGPASEPETKAIMALLATQHYSKVISLHSAGGLVDFDGPGGSALAQRIAVAAGLRVVHLISLYRYSGSMGGYVPTTYRIPIITWELSSPVFAPRVRAGLLAAMW